MNKLLLRSSYFYNLPEEQIAQYPVENRSGSRLLHMDRNNGEVTHKKFSEIISFFRSGDILVRNHTKVIPARLFGKKTTGADVEIFLVDELETNIWNCLVKPGRRLMPGAKVVFSDTLKAEIIDMADEGMRKVRFEPTTDLFNEIDKIGKTPLPPYIKRAVENKDKETYQTVYSEIPGSVAAPTAGLHFTDEILSSIQDMGIEIIDVLLHVGLGTFRPVKNDNIQDHSMHSEFCTISQETADKINDAKAEGRRIIAVGTTTCRTLESFADSGKLTHGEKWTNLFLYPGKEFQIIDGLITNFHMPESTLLMLVSAFGGYESTMKAYNEAVAERYRFFSYGDSMIII